MTSPRTPAGMAGRPGRADWVVQRRARSCRCQRRIVHGVTSSPSRRRTGSSRLRAAITARSVQLIRGRGVRRRSTASWWRRTRISISLPVWDRLRSTSSRALRTSHRSASVPPADHAGWLDLAKQQVSGRAPIFGLCVPETRRTSRDLLIFVEQPAKPVPAADVVDPGSGVVGKWSQGSVWVPRTVSGPQSSTFAFSRRHGPVGGECSDAATHLRTRPQLNIIGHHPLHLRARLGRARRPP